MHADREEGLPAAPLKRSSERIDFVVPSWICWLQTDVRRLHKRETRQFDAKTINVYSGSKKGYNQNELA